MKSTSKLQIICILAACSTANAISLEETQSFVVKRNVSYSVPMNFDMAVKESLVSIQVTALKQFRLGGKNWKWENPKFKDSYKQATKDVAEILRDNWNRCTLPVLVENSNSGESLANAYKYAMPKNLTEEEFEELKAFYKSPVGKKYLAYISFAKRVYMDADVARQKRDLEFPGYFDSQVSVKSKSEEIQFLVAVYKALRITVDSERFAQEMAFNLSFLPKVYAELVKFLSQEEREKINHFLKTSAGLKEADLIDDWAGKFGMNLYMAEKKCNDEKKLSELMKKWEP
ncbi:DUF2059 domain-containing protein [Undibacterium sp. TC4M20W]|uniref:DUF2059 domain-containing protein n=1 Tax=Undibacterium sp. TC4M20W TaxID=3413052 RepID=UPI003BF2295A